MKVLNLLVLIGSLLYIQPAIANVVSDEREQKWQSTAGESAQEPLCQNNNDSNFWFEEIEGDHTVYWQFNEVYDTVKESIANFATRLTSYVAEYRVGKLILDLRLNMGGSNSSPTPLRPCALQVVGKLRRSFPVPS